MFKALLFSDLHWSTYSSIIRKRGDRYSVRLHTLINTFNWIEKLADEFNVDAVISCGDTCDTSTLNAEEITAFNEVQFSNRKHYYLVGNHESNVSSLDYSSTHVLSNDFSEIIDKPKNIEINDKVDLTFIPYITGDVPPLSSFIKNSSKKNIVFAHQEIAGLKYGKFISQSGFEVDDILNNCTVFIDGHLHNEQMLCNNKIVLIGNVCGQNFNEDAHMYRHLVYVLTINDDGTISLDPIENPYAFNFYKIKIEKEDDINELKHLKDNAVVSVFCNSIYNDRVVELLDCFKSSGNVLGDKIVESKITLFYNNINSSNNIDCFKIEDHFKLFIDFAQQKFEKTPILEDELSRLGGYKDEVEV